MLAPAGKVYVSGDVHIDTARAVIRRGGSEYSLRPKTYRLLVYLIEHRDRLVPKEELISCLWGDTAVTDGALAQCIADIRRALDEDPKNPRFIRTASRLGYQFIGPIENPAQPLNLVLIEEVTHHEVEVTETIVDEPRPRLNWRLVALAVLPVAALIGWRAWPRVHLPAVEPPIRTAIFQFENRTGSAESDWLRAGVADMLSTSLAASPRIAVITAGQLQRSMQAQPQTAVTLDNAIRAARASGASAFIMGSVASLGGTMRVDAQIYDTARGQLLGGESLTVDQPGQLLSRLDPLSAKLAARLGAPLVAQAPIAEVMTNNLEAYRLYSLGLARTRAYRISEGVGMYERAIAIDPDFAMAHARIGHAYAIADADPDRGKPYLEKAFQLANRLTPRDRLFIHAWYAMASRDYDGAERAYRNIITAYPTEVEVYLSLAALLIGERRPEEAREILTRGLEIERNMPEMHNMVSAAYRDLGQADLALASARRYVEVSHGEANAYDTVALLHQGAGRYAEARQAYETALARKPDFDIAVIHLANLNFQLGRYRDALAGYREYIRLANSPGSRARGHHSLSWVYWRKGDSARAEAEGVEALRWSPASADQRLWVSMIRGEPVHGLSLQPPTPPFALRGSRPNRRTWYFMAGSIDLRERGAEALEYFRAALREPQLVWALDSLDTCLGDAYASLGRLDEAAAEYRRVLSVNPNYPMALYRLGLTLERKGSIGEARQEFKRFLTVWKDADPDIPELIDAKRKIHAE